MLAKLAEEIIPASPLPGMGPVDLSLELPEGVSWTPCSSRLCLVNSPPSCSGTNHVWSSPVPNPNEPNSALTYYVQYGSKIDRRLRVTAALLTQILSEPAFNVLRTKEQLGYIVAASAWSAPGDNDAGLRIVVQSERGPVYLEERVEAFLDHMKGVIELMTDEEFAEQKNGLERKWREVAKNLNEEVSRFWAEIDSGYLDFLRRKPSPFSFCRTVCRILTQPIGIEDAEFLKTISKQDVLSLFLSRVHPSSKTRSKLSTHLQSRKPRPKHISRAAANAFAVVVQENDIQVEEDDWCSSLFADGEPTEVQFSSYWKGVLADAPEGTSDRVLAALPHLLEHFPAEKDAQGSLAKDVIHIDDIQAFKKSLKVSEYPKPLVAWDNTLTSKF